MQITYIRSNNKCVSIRHMTPGIFYRNIQDDRDCVYYLDHSYALIQLDLMTLHSKYMNNVDGDVVCYYPVVVTAYITVKDL